MDEQPPPLGAARGAGSARPIADLPVEEARAALVRAWLDRFGPGTVEDIKWWTGWTLGHTRAALAGARRGAVDLDGQEGLVLAGDTDAPAARAVRHAAAGPRPHHHGVEAARLVPRRPPARIFDTNGNGGPTVWVDGRIVGGWAQRKTGEVVFRLLEDIGAERADGGRASGRPTWSGCSASARVVVRFPGPLDKELVR